MIRKKRGFRPACLLLGAVLWSGPGAGQTHAEPVSAQDLERQAGALRRWIEQKPEDAEGHARLGMVYRRLGRTAEAVRELEQALRLDPKLPRAEVLLALAYIEAGRCPDAIPLLSAGLEAEQQPAIRSVVGRRLAECHLATGDDQRALAVVQRLRQSAPDDPDVLQLALKTYLISWNAAFQRLLTLAPGSPQVRQITAEALESEERFAEAAQEYRKILEVHPSLPDIHYRLGRALLRSDASAAGEEGALQEFRKEVEINPAHAAALAAIGEIQGKRGESQQAARTFQRALEVQPGFVPARVGLAKVWIAEKQWSKAVEQLEAAARLAPEDEAVYYNLMLAYRGQDRTADAQRALETFQRLQREHRLRRSPLARSVSPP